jgi:hypothetical protein
MSDWEHLIAGWMLPSIQALLLGRWNLVGWISN